ncbi:MAG: hypothetical protein H6837_02830 [Planctomycetes bacterium]|nr:hypothetical protein [Planctomycetota bacterium]
MRIPLALARSVLQALVSAAALSAQATHVVDASGRPGTFRSIVAAVQAAGSGDRVLIYPGVYDGTIELAGKPLTLVGVTGNAWDVLVRPTFANGTGLIVRQQPAGSVTRIASLTLDQLGGLTNVAVIGLGAGDVFVDNVWSARPWDVLDWRGAVALSRCIAKVIATPSLNPTYSFRFVKVDHVFLRDCVFEADYASPFGGPADCVVIESCVAEVVQCSIAGPWASGGSARWPSDGGTALRAFSSRIRISGDGTDVISGGRSEIFAGSRGGYGVVLQSAILQWSGTTLRGGVAIGQGSAGKPLYVDPLSQVGTSSPPIPVVHSRGVRFGKMGRFDLLAWPNAVSLTVASPSVSPVTTALGVLALDLAQPLLPVVSVHDANGLASIPVDLRQLPSGLVGTHFGVQLLAAAANAGPVLSAPWVGIVQ